MVDVWCGGCLVWWMSGVVDVSVVDDSAYDEFMLKSGFQHGPSLIGATKSNVNQLTHV